MNDNLLLLRAHTLGRAAHHHQQAMGAAALGLASVSVWHVREAQRLERAAKELRPPDPAAESSEPAPDRPAAPSARAAGRSRLVFVTAVQLDLFGGPVRLPIPAVPPPGRDAANVASAAAGGRRALSASAL